MKLQGETSFNCKGGRQKILGNRQHGWFISSHGKKKKPGKANSWGDSFNEHLVKKDHHELLKEGWLLFIVLGKHFFFSI